MLNTSLNTFAAKMNTRHPDMNYGGCAVFAVHMAKRLEKIVPTRIKLFDYEVLNVDSVRERILPENRADINQWHNREVYFCHIIVEFDFNGVTYHFDTTGIREANNEWRGYVLCDGSFTIPEMEVFAASPYGWNDRFDRQEIPAIKRQVKNLFARHLYHYYLTKTLSPNNTKRVKTLLKSR